ncbi:MAG: NAD(P)-dependent glycerol-3-phosphate dehydrogenase [Armatimonadetes bacterium]|nr:NAD(P)-dependent glycerol-3-phosphate dehydrogenase [Armatimonadota bacterium]
MADALVLGAGSWGTALAILLAQKGLKVDLWGRDPEQIEQMKRDRANGRYLPNAPFPDTLCPVTEPAPSPVVVVAVPCSAAREVLERARFDSPIYVLASKGLEMGTGLRPSETLLQVVGSARFAALSGPNLATELAQGVPTATVAASPDRETAKSVQAMFMSACLRVYTNSDVAGVELGGGLKNVYAISAGMSDGLGFGDNTKGALLTRGLAEMTRLGVACGAKRETFTGLSGVGDLIATACSRLSRNYRLGRAIGEGAPPQTALNELGQVAEGFNTAMEGEKLAARVGAEAPIMSVVAATLRGETTPAQALASLMSRPPKEENETFA